MNRKNATRDHEEQLINFIVQLRSTIGFPKMYKIYDKVIKFITEIIKKKLES